MQNNAVGLHALTCDGSNVTTHFESYESPFNVQDVDFVNGWGGSPRDGGSGQITGSNAMFINTRFIKNGAPDHGGALTLLDGVHLTEVHLKGVSGPEVSLPSLTAVALTRFSWQGRPPAPSPRHGLPCHVLRLDSVHPLGDDRWGLLLTRMLKCLRRLISLKITSPTTLAVVAPSGPGGQGSLGMTLEL